ncbi:hypothetical protein [Endozoicomonas lisbonensis]|uniref:CO dehydrogenase/acetyl-CoA synthase beta subunit n=1 Tax=Endozoicomonas lisbonensis TaxID=3120522 RepID=A0ABV2SBR2_9GAMM
MSEDIAFKIQLGLILPKLKDKLSSDLTDIVRELVQIVSAGSIEDDDAPDIDSVKEVIMKDLEIFLDKEIFPVIEAEMKPAQEDEQAEEATEEAEEATETEEEPEPESS